MSYYLYTLGIYFAVDALAALGLNLQYGLTGIINFAFIVFQAVGAYAYALTSIGQSGRVLSEHYFFGVTLPFPVPYLMAALAGGVFALIFGPIALRRMRRDYQAAVTLAVGIILNQFLATYVPALNGAAGLSNIPGPFTRQFIPVSTTWVLVYMLGALAVTAVAFAGVQYVTRSRFGLMLRALRDDDDATMISGVNPIWPKLWSFVLGGVLGGLSGGILVGFVGSWGPSSWTYGETLVILVGILLGGSGNNRGVLLGTLLVGVVFFQGVQFLPEIGYPGLVDQLETVLTGVIWLAVLWYRPRGLIPERPLIGGPQRAAAGSWQERVRRQRAHPAGTASTAAGPEGAVNAREGADSAGTHS